MPLTDLNEIERGVVRDCLRAAIEGPFFPDWEFHTLFGLDRNEMKSILKSWPNVDENSDSVALAINNSLNNLLGYPSSLQDQEWTKFVSVSKAEVKRIFDKWKGGKVQSYFNGAR